MVVIGTIVAGLAIGVGAGWMSDGHRGHPAAVPGPVHHHASGASSAGHRKASAHPRGAELRHVQAALASAQKQVLALKAQLRRATATTVRLKRQLAAQPVWLQTLLSELGRRQGGAADSWLRSWGGWGT